MAQGFPIRGDHFPRLANPPIVEASINWRARAGRSFDESEWKVALAAALPKYTRISSTQQAFAPGGAGHAMKLTVGTEGLHLSTADGKMLAQATVDGLRFTLRQPYTHWDVFIAEATPVWDAFRKVAQPIEVQRMTLRFVNRFAGANAEQVATILKDPPSCPMGFALQDFTCQNTLRVPGEPYAVRIVKHLSLNGPQGVILDISAYTLEPSEPGDLESLSRLRNLKNSVFFSLLTDSEISKRESP